MRRSLLCLFAMTLLIAPLAGVGDAGAEPVSQYKQKSYRDGGVVLRMDAEKGSVLNPGEEISFTYQTSDDAYVILFNIDTEGYVHLLHPFDGPPPLAPARRTHRVPGGADRLLVSGETGMEFVFALTVPDRSALDGAELDYLRDIETRPIDERYRIDGDPFLAANIIAGELVRGISHREGVFLDYTYFYVNQRVDHPCYLCGECDGSAEAALCDDYDLVADFDRSSSQAYPLQRAYAVVDRDAPVSDETDIGVVYSGDTDDDDYDDGDRVNVTFYPYTAEVRYVTRPWVYSYDYDWYDPLWYDPWYCGYVYYPRYHYPYYGHYYSWGFSWGYWGGYYCSGWYYPRYDYWRDYYRYNYYDYASYRSVRYKTALKERSKTLHKNSLVSLRDQTVRRNDHLKIASKDLKRSLRTTKGRSVDTAYKKRGTTTRNGKTAVKTTRVKNRRSGSTIKSRSLKPTRARSATPRVKSNTSKRRSTGTKSRSTYKPQSRSRSKSSGRTVKPRSSSKSRSYKGNTSSKRSRSSVKSAPRRSSSSSKPRAVKRSSGSSRSKPSVKRSTSSSRSKSPARSSGSRSSGSSKSKTKSKRR